MESGNIKKKKQREFVFFRSHRIYDGSTYKLVIRPLFTLFSEFFMTNKIGVFSLGYSTLVVFGLTSISVLKIINRN